MPVAMVARIAAPPLAKFSSSRMGEMLPGRAMVAGKAACRKNEEGEGVRHCCSCWPPRRDASGRDGRGRGGQGRETKPPCK